MSITYNGIGLVTKLQQGQLKDLTGFNKYGFIVNKTKPDGTKSMVSYKNEVTALEFICLDVWKT